MDLGVVLGVIGAGISFGAAGLGCGVALGRAGQAAAGVIAEDPRKFGQALVLQAVGTTSAIYGLLLGFLILTKALTVTDVGSGLALLVAGAIMGIIGMAVSIEQGKTMVAGIILIGKRSGEMAKALIIIAIVETIQIFALLFAFLIYDSV